MFSEHEIGLKLVNPNAGQMQYPDCGSARLEPHAFDPDTPVEELVEEEER